MELCCRNRGTCCRWNPSPRALLITAWFSFWIQQMCGQASSGAEVINAILNEMVTLTAPIRGQLVAFTWYRGNRPLKNNIIISLIISQKRLQTGLGYTRRETVLTDGSLQIKDVRANDNGNFTRNIVVVGKTPEVIVIELKVYARVSVPIISAAPEKPIENEALILNCYASLGTEVFYQWIHKNSMVYDGGRISLSNKNQTLALSSCIRSDSGTNFTCRAYNAVSNASSKPFLIKFGSKGHINHGSYANQPGYKLPAWAVAVIVLAVLSSVVFIIALFRYNFIKHPLSLPGFFPKTLSAVTGFLSKTSVWLPVKVGPICGHQKGQDRGTGKQQRPAKVVVPTSSTGVPAIKKVKAPGQKVKKTVTFAPGTKLGDSSSSHKQMEGPVELLKL